MYLDSFSTSPRWLGFMWTHRGPLLAAHPLSLWKITNTHKVRMEPSQPPTEPIWSSLKHSNYLPPRVPTCVAAAFSLFIWTNRITVGLRWIDCDQGWEAPESSVTGAFAEPLRCVKLMADLPCCVSPTSSPLFPDSKALVCWRMPSLLGCVTSADWWGNVPAGWRIPLLGKYMFIGP